MSSLVWPDSLCIRNLALTDGVTIDTLVNMIPVKPLLCALPRPKMTNLGRAVSKPQSAALKQISLVSEILNQGAD